MQHIRIIHCADLHLDSCMESHLSRFQAQTRRKELFQTFVRLADYAALHEVCAVLICGDLFDTEHVAPSTITAFKNCLEEHLQIDFLYLPGNHDAQIQAVFQLEEQWPENFWIFQEKTLDSNLSLQAVCSKEYGLVTITGIAENMDPVLNLSSSRINLVMLHGQIHPYKTTGYSPKENCFQYSLSDLSGKNIHYAAAGHIHQYRLEKIDAKGQYCYSGCLEGRGFDECGKKGFVLLDIAIDDKIAAGDKIMEVSTVSNISEYFQITPEFIPFASREIYDLEFEVTKDMKYADLDKQISKLLSEIDARHMVRLKLTGSVPLDYMLPVDLLFQKYTEDFFLFRVENCTRPAICYEDYQYDISLKGEFIRCVLSDTDLNDVEKEQIIMEGLHALAGEEILINQ